MSRMTADQKADFGAQIRTVRFEDLIWMQARIGMEIARKNEAIRSKQAKADQVYPIPAPPESCRPPSALSASTVVGYSEHSHSEVLSEETPA